MVYAGQFIRLFISSTFYDMQMERNILQVHVFPRLRILCSERGARFQAVDLRWGVSQEASQDHRTLAICLEEIRRSRQVSPHFNFLALLGERHGSDLLPEQIDEHEFTILLNNMNPNERETIRSWYRLDRNANSLLYVLKSREKKRYPTYKDWEPVQRDLHSILATACKRAQLDEAAQTKYLASATELEILEGVLQYSPDEAQPLCCFRTIDGVLRDGTASLYIEQDAEKYARLAGVKQRLRERAPDSVYEYRARWNGQGYSKDHLATFCEEMYRRLKARIEAALDHAEQVKQAEPETTAFRNFAKQITSNFVPRDTAIAAIVNISYQCDLPSPGYYRPIGFRQIHVASVYGECCAPCAE